jgi:hypothetical protein
VWRRSLNSSNLIESLPTEIGSSCPRALGDGAAHSRTKNIRELSDDVTLTKRRRDVDQADDQVVFSAGLRKKKKEKKVKFEQGNY